LVGLAYASNHVHELSHVLVCGYFGGDWKIYYGPLLDPQFAECNDYLGGPRTTLGAPNDIYLFASGGFAGAGFALAIRAILRSTPWRNYALVACLPIAAMHIVSLIMETTIHNWYIANLQSWASLLATAVGGALFILLLERYERRRLMPKT
jgi:hypothetical protein